jgi:hypothetical protein
MSIHKSEFERAHSAATAEVRVTEE